MFTHVNILTSDLARSTSFYEGIFDAKLLYKLGEKKRAYLIGDFEFYITEVDEPNVHPDFHLGIRADDALFDDLLRTIGEAGVPLVKGNNPTAEVHQMNEDRKAFYFRDPDGIMIEVYTPDTNVKKHLGL